MHQSLETYQSEKTPGHRLCMSKHNWNTPTCSCQSVHEFNHITVTNLQAAAKLSTGRDNLLAADCRHTVQIRGGSRKACISMHTQGWVTKTQLRIKTEGKCSAQNQRNQVERGESKQEDAVWQNQIIWWSNVNLIQQSIQKPAGF